MHRKKKKPSDEGLLQPKEDYSDIYSTNDFSSSNSFWNSIPWIIKVLFFIIIIIFVFGGLMILSIFGF